MKKRTTTVLLAVIAIVAALSVFSSAVQAVTWYVDDDNCPGPGIGTQVDPFCSIQDGIDAASDGDEVVVAIGTYFENLDLDGKAITLRSTSVNNTFIDGNQVVKPVIRFVSGEDSNTVVDGFTITGGIGEVGRGGGGIHIRDSSPTILNCRVVNNSAAPSFTTGSGGGIYSEGGMPTFRGCLISGNHASNNFSHGGGMYGPGVLVDCTISSNSVRGSNSSQSGIALLGGSMLRCTIRFNQGGFAAVTAGGATLTDTVICSNSSDNQLSGTFIDGGGNLIQDVCPPGLTTGACCLDLTCIMATPNSCNTAGGTYQGNGVTCPSVSCTSQGCPDIDGDGFVDITDLFLMFAQWGQCP